MASKMNFNEPDFGKEASHGDDVAKTSTGTTDPMSPGQGEDTVRTVTSPISPGQGDAVNRNDLAPELGMDKQPTRGGSTDTAVEGDQQRTNSAVKNKIDNTPTARDFENSTDQPKVKSPKHRKIYVHHRHTRGLTKRFTAGSAFSHIPFLKHHSHSKEKAPEDLESEDGHVHRNVSVWHNLWIMCTSFPYWNMAFWSGWCYSIGSALFIISSCFSWVDLGWPGIENESLVKYGGPLSFFFGACLYQIGGVMAYLEAINDGCFAGAAMKRLLEGHKDIEKELLDAKLHTFFGHLVPHHHHDDDDDDHNGGTSVDASRNNWDSITRGDSNPEDVYDEAKERVERRQGVDHGSADIQHQQGEVREYLTWRWWPTWHSLIHYHIRELGYVACTVQLFGVTLFGVTSIVILPGIYDSLAWWQLVAAYWVPQTVASSCFIIASIMFTIMAQDNWKTPKWGAVSWWIGIHALIGSCGFLCVSHPIPSSTHTDFLQADRDLRFL